MTKVIFDISMSLDGFIAAPNDRPGDELGDGGQRLHAWLFDEASETGREVLNEVWNGAGAVISGARTFDICFDVWGASLPPSSPGSCCLTTSQSGLRRARRRSTSS